MDVSPNVPYQITTRRKDISFRRKKLSATQKEIVIFCPSLPLSIITVVKNLHHNEKEVVRKKSFEFISIYLSFKRLFPLKLSHEEGHHTSDSCIETKLDMYKHLEDIEAALHV